MDKQEFQQTIKNMKYKKDCVYMSSFEVFLKGFEKAKELALLHSNSIDEPEKPVVPQYVADWYEDNKDVFENSIYDLCVNLFKDASKDNLYKWFSNNNNKPIVTLVKMKLFGYEVEKEKLYRVELPNPNGDSNRYGLCKVDGRIVIGCFIFGLNKATNTKLTEAEIKKDFEWAFRWAKEVEE